MTTESLTELESAFANWRRNKKHINEPVPSDLIERAQRQTIEHGIGPVAYRLKVQAWRLGKTSAPKPRNKSVAPIPTFTRVEVSAPPGHSGPLVELESRRGVKLRVFQVSKETSAVLADFYHIFGGDA